MGSSSALVICPVFNRKVYGFGLVDWFDGRVAPGWTADVFCEQVRAAVARSTRRGHVAIVLADNLKTLTLAGSLLLRSMPTELKEHLYLACTPAYDPDANRIEWLWRVSRRVVTHNHQRSDFDLLLADVETHSIFKRSLRVPLMCSVIPAVRLPQTHPAFALKQIQLDHLGSM